MDNKIYQELKSDFYKVNKNKWNSTRKYRYKKFLYWIILLILFIPQITLLFTKKTYEYVSDFDNLPEPIQTPASWWTTIKIYWEKIYIDFLAKYEVSWKVISARNYIGADVIRELWPRDFVLWWWKMWRQEYIDKFHWNDMKDRYIYAYVPYENVDWFNKEFDADLLHGNRWTCGISYSNNHPIPANRKIRLLMKKIKEWDMVRLKWYLVYVHPEKWNRYRWPSSLVRDDHGCEIIYVTDVVRLKEKKN